MIDFIQQHYIPVAIKAGRVANPPPGIEGELYRELKRTQPAPQGMAVMNSNGNVQAWVLMFEDNPSVLQFLEREVERFEKGLGEASPPAAERFHRFPNHRMADLPASPTIGNTNFTLNSDTLHSGGFTPRKNTIAGRIVGRALDAEGTPIDAGVRSQETYAEDRIEIPLPAVEALIAAAVEAEPGETFPVPAPFARELVSSAYLGMLDVNPLAGGKVGGEILTEEIHFLVRKPAKGESTLTLELWGQSLSEGKSAQLGRPTDNRDWKNRVNLTWVGRIELKEKKLKSLFAIGEGQADFHWNHGVAAATDEEGVTRTHVANLPAGRPINFSGPVRFGISIP